MRWPGSHHHRYSRADEARDGGYERRAGDIAGSGGRGMTDTNSSGTEALNSVLRTALIDRNTTETRISLRLTIEGKGRYTVSTGIRFFDHMLELFTRHGAFDMELKCEGDLDVDQHHTVEDVGIALGEAFDRALGDKRGILRAGYFIMPMD